MNPHRSSSRPMFGLTVVLGATAALSGCRFVQGAPSVAANLTVASQYNFRGVPQNEKGVVQPDMNVSIPSAGGGSLNVGGWANMDVRDDTGDAVFPNGHGGEFSEIDLIGSYSRTHLNVSYTLGVINYNFPGNPLSQVPTTEVFGAAEWDSAGWKHTLTTYWDVDEFNGLYTRVDIVRGWSLDSRTAFDLGFGIGYSDGEHALRYYGVSEGGLADLTATGSLTYRFDAQTTGSIFVSASTLVDGAYEDAVQLAGIETENLWAGVGLGWGF